MNIKKISDVSGETFADDINARLVSATSHRVMAASWRSLDLTSSLEYCEANSLL